MSWRRWVLCSTVSCDKVRARSFRPKLFEFRRARGRLAPVAPDQDPGIFVASVNTSDKDRIEDCCCESSSIVSHNIRDEREVPYTSGRWSAADCTQRFLSRNAQRKPAVRSAGAVPRTPLPYTRRAFEQPEASHVVLSCRTDPRICLAHASPRPLAVWPLKTYLVSAATLLHSAPGYRVDCHLVRTDLC